VHPEPSVPGYAALAEPSSSWAPARLRPWPLAMGAFLYRCPNTGLRVQGWVADDPTERDDDAYQPVTCLICTRIHLIDPKTGKVLGSDDC